MKRRRLFWFLTPRLLALILAFFLAVTWQVSSTFKTFYQNELEKSLGSYAYLVGEKLKDLPLNKTNFICQELGQRTGTRITVVGESGTVIADTEKDPSLMNNHRERQEIEQAFSQGQGMSIRFSQTLKKEMMYVALLHSNLDGEPWVVRTSLSTTDIDNALMDFYWRLTVGGSVIVLFAIILSLILAQRISRPLEQMKAGAEKYASGDLTARLAVPEEEETAALAEALNRMASELDKRIQIVIKQRGELEAVLASMEEGVLAVDTEERILRINDAAARYWQLDPDDVIGKHLSEVVRNADLSHFVQKALENYEPVEAEIELENNGGFRILQAHGTVLAMSPKKRVGALIVFSDVTRLKQLESMRQDFVANVSHELKTPITSIKGFAETLLSGALSEEEDAKKFVGIIQNQSNRLEAIISDLMMLSRLEQGDKLVEETLIEADLMIVLESAKQSCEHRAREKNIQIVIRAPGEPVKAKINIQLLEQAVINLLINAINYSPNGSEVHLRCEKENGSLLLKVIDQGIGIAKEHLPRLFERFYRVDKGRSRELGGTGLGLAIVKHIARAHGGDAQAESLLGKGSTFLIQIPAHNVLLNLNNR